MSAEPKSKSCKMGHPVRKPLRIRNQPADNILADLSATLLPLSSPEGKPLAAEIHPSKSIFLNIQEIEDIETSIS